MCMCRGDADPERREGGGGKKEVKREGVGERGRGDEPHGQDNTF